jgi:hypothetical protein
MELGVETAAGEVWWEFKRRSNPDRYARKAILPVSRLHVFYGCVSGQQAEPRSSEGEVEARLSGRSLAARRSDYERPHHE